MTDFPRGWTLSVNVVAPTVGSITVPAIAGVVHVLDSFDAKITGSAAIDVDLSLTSSDGTFTAFELAHLFCPAAATSDDASAQGLDLAAGPGASLTIAFSVTSRTETLVIQGHDI